MSFFAIKYSKYLLYFIAKNVILWKLYPNSYQMGIYRFNCNLTETLKVIGIMLYSKFRANRLFIYMITRDTTTEQKKVFFVRQYVIGK